MCGVVCKCVSDGVKMVPQTALHQHCQALLQENHTLRQTATENSAAKSERGSGEDKRVTEMLLTQLITDTSEKVPPLVGIPYFMYGTLIHVLACSTNHERKYIFVANKKCKVARQMGGNLTLARLADF